MIVMLKLLCRASGHIKFADNWARGSPYWKRILIVFAHHDVRLLWTIASGVWWPGRSLDVTRSIARNSSKALCVRFDVKLMDWRVLCGGVAKLRQDDARQRSRFDLTISIAVPIYYNQSIGAIDLRPELINILYVLLEIINLLFIYVSNNYIKFTAQIF